MQNKKSDEKAERFMLTIFLPSVIGVLMFRVITQGTEFEDFIHYLSYAFIAALFGLFLIVTSKKD